MSNSHKQDYNYGFFQKFEYSNSNLFNLGKFQKIDSIQNTHGYTNSILNNFELSKEESHILLKSTNQRLNSELRIEQNEPNNCKKNYFFRTLTSTNNEDMNLNYKKTLKKSTINYLQNQITGNNNILSENINNNQQYGINIYN